MSNLFYSLGFDVIFKGANFSRLLEGIGVSLRISLISVVISILLGIILGAVATLKIKAYDIFFRIYLEIVRIMPQLVLLFIVYFGTTKALKINIEAELSAIIVFTFWGSAEMADLVRGAFAGIDKIQYESSESLGLNKSQTYIYIIFPQVIRRLIPQSINLITRMIKTTSLVMMIGVVEVLKVAQQIIEANRMSSPNAAFGVFAVVFIGYFLVCWPISIVSKILEAKWEQ